MDRTERRAAALQAAAMLPWAATGRSRLVGAVLEAAHAFDAWLSLQTPVADFAITADTPTPRGATMSLTFIDGDEVTLRIKNPVDAEGEGVTDTFTWAVDNGDVLVLTPADDTMSCLATPGTVAGSAVVSATASDGVVRTFAIDVTTGPLASFEIVNDEPVARPAPTPAPTA